MYVVTVIFDVKLEHLEDFRVAMLEQARNSLSKEDGCRCFDVCEDEQRAGRIFLYEIYDHRAAFDAHLESDHYKTFDALTAAWVDNKEVAIYSRIEL